MPPEFWKNYDIKKPLEQPKVFSTAKEKSNKAEKELENKIKLTKEKLWKNYKKWLEELEYKEAEEKIDKYWEKLRQLWETKKEVETYIKQDTEKKLSSFVKEFKNDLSWITKIYENKKLFWDSFKTFTALLRDKKNNELWEKIYDAFATNSDIAWKLEYYLEKWIFKINNIQDVEKLLKILNSPKNLKDKKNKNLENDNNLDESVEDNDLQKLNKFLKIYENYSNFNEKYKWNFEKAVLDIKNIKLLLKKLVAKTWNKEYKKVYKSLINNFKKYKKIYTAEKKQDTAEKKWTNSFGFINKNMLNYTILVPQRDRDIMAVCWASTPDWTSNPVTRVRFSSVAPN